MRQTRQIMGMPISVDIPGCQDESVFEPVFARLNQVDEKFSTYKTDSEVSRFRRGELKERDLSAELKAVIEGCRRAEAETDGYFSAWAAGAFDPSGYVKGWAVAQAGKIIESQGYGTYCIGAGGDILARSRPTHHGQDEYERIWQIGIQDPKDRTKILNKISISNGAVCTSGSYERGFHIVNPKTGRPANELLSVTVTGPDIIRSDVLATACFAMGGKAEQFMKSQKNYQALIVQ